MLTEMTVIMVPLFELVCNETLATVISNCHIISYKSSLKMLSAVHLLDQRSHCALNLGFTISMCGGTSEGLAYHGEDMTKSIFMK